MQRTTLILSPALALLLAACSDPAARQQQKEQVAQATGLYSRCRFEAVIAAADRALAMQMADPQAYSFALMLKARSLEQLGRDGEAEQIYRELVELAGDVNDVGQARKVARTLDVMREGCAGTATTSGQEAPPAAPAPPQPPG